MSKRTYTQRKRAQQQDLTRQKIVEATMRLHEDLGAARTTVSAVARQAGVQRLTVYRHFPDETALLEACTTRWLELHPLPTPATWNDCDEPGDRVRAALRAFFVYYRDTAGMWQSSYRDMDTVPALAERMGLVEDYLDGIAADLTAPFALTAEGHRQAAVVVRHGLRFATWQSLTRGPQDDAGLADDEAADLVAAWLGAVRARDGAG